MIATRSSKGNSRSGAGVASQSAAQSKTLPEDDSKKFYMKPSLKVVKGSNFAKVPIIAVTPIHGFLLCSEAAKLKRLDPLWHEAVYLCRLKAGPSGHGRWKVTLILS
jgi:hypothetical protein